MKTLISITLVVLTIGVAFSQERKQTINKEFDFTPGPNKVFIVDNINGFVKVEGYDGSKVVMEAKELMKAKSQSALDYLVKNVQLGIEESKDTLQIYVDGTCNCNCGNHRRYNWNNCELEGDFLYDFTIKVPKGMNIWLSTVNNGDIEVKNVLGKLQISNINGAISLDGVAGGGKVKTINGDVKITYQSVPTQDSEYYTLNGDLTVFLPSSLSADMSFKSFNGEFYTNFDISERLPSFAQINQEDGHGTKYKIDEKTKIRVGKGGVNLDFETFNGDIFIKKN